MKDNALSVANYFVSLAENSNNEIKTLRLMKLVYIAHGYMLAIFNRSVLSPKFDRVEAWKYGPVIPSVYHSFKIYRNNPIKKKTIIYGKETDAGVEILTPTLSDKEAIMVCDFVWGKYGKYNDCQLVTILHRKGTPWGMVYEEGMNREIPDELTKSYYKRLVEQLLKVARA